MASRGVKAKPGETLDRICEVLEVFQDRRGYRFGIESLILAAFVRPGAQRVVDLGCGSGVIPLVLLRFGKVESAIGVEIQPALADRARRSVAHNGFSDRIEILQADLRSLHRVLPAGGFDLVVSNPPYRPKASGQVSRGRERAVGRHEILCTLSEVVASAGRLLKPQGRLDLIFPPGRLPELLGACGQHGLRPARLRLAHGRRELSSKTALLEAVRGGRMGLSIEPPLIIYDSTGSYTEEVQGMLYPAR